MKKGDTSNIEYNKLVHIKKVFWGKILVSNINANVFKNNNDLKR